MNSRGYGLFAVRLAAFAVAAAVVFAAAAPSTTADIWFHLTMGRTYLAQGLWPAGDPVLFTATARTPVQHEWLFGVAMHLIERLFGLQALRMTHALLVAGLIALFAVLLRSRVRDPYWIALGGLLAVTLSWLRLNQLRPDLVSIGMTLAVVLLLLDPPRGPSSRAIAAAVALSLFWTNMHSLFAVGLAVIAAGALGAFAESALGDYPGGLAVDGGAQVPGQAGRRPRRLLASLVLMAAAGLCNPRGPAQLLTFFSSSDQTAIWGIRDEWHRFNPFLPFPPYNSPALQPLQWAVADLVFLLFIAAFLVSYLAWRRTPSPERLAELDLAGFLVGAAALGAILISFRFLWLAILPLRYAAITFSRLHPRPGRALAGLFAAIAIAVALLFPSLGGYLLMTSDTPRTAAAWLHEPYNRRRFSEAAVDFLKGSAVRGNLFNPYTLGGFLGYRLAPQLRLFIDGRTEHYPISVALDYVEVSEPRPGQRRSPPEILESYAADLFLGRGGPAYGYQDRDTRRILENARGWVLVYRTMDHAVYLRRNARNADNLRRIADYWGARNIPFDAERGFEPQRVIDARADWAQAQGLVPSGFGQYVRRSRSGDPRERLPALLALGEIYGVAGAYPGMLDADRQALTLDPGNGLLRRRIAETESYLARRAAQETSPSQEP